MFDFDDYEDLGDYVFTYTAKEILDREYHIWLRKSKSKKTYEEFAISFVKEKIMYGYNRHRELEPEWEKLKFCIEEVEKENSIEKAVILYDQVLQLFCEGHPLPPNFL